ncbi:MAG: helix-turn-helix transcriptional regulator [Clostridia bacterium]|nr:helix-turn-helix transcriptional regulator [Clostridia bacterium]
MKTSVLKDIISYIEFLRNHGYYISLSCFENRFEPFTTELLPYEIHLHSVCSYLKQNKATLGRCVLNKHKLNNAQISKPIYSCCYAGVEEYVIPIIYEEKAIMCINISGYRSTLQKSKYRMEQIAELCDHHFIEAYNELSESVPCLEHVMTFIKPLEYMVIELYKDCLGKNSKENTSQTKSIYLKAMEYIHENYMHKISCDTLAREMNYSLSYLRYIFKKECNSSVNKQINEVRLERAKYLLLNTTLNITEIALCCGFCDSNYFSTVFKSKYGVPPKLYKRQT